LLFSIQLERELFPFRNLFVFFFNAPEKNSFVSLFLLFLTFIMVLMDTGAMLVFTTLSLRLFGRKECFGSFPVPREDLGFGRLFSFCLVVSHPSLPFPDPAPTESLRSRSEKNPRPLRPPIYIHSVPNLAGPSSPLSFLLFFSSRAFG